MHELIRWDELYWITLASGSESLTPEDNLRKNWIKICLFVTMLVRTIHSCSYCWQGKTPCACKNICSICTTLFVVYPACEYYYENSAKLKKFRNDWMVNFILTVLLKKINLPENAIFFLDTNVISYQTASEVCVFLLIHMLATIKGPKCCWVY